MASYKIFIPPPGALGSSGSLMEGGPHFLPDTTSSWALTKRGNGADLSQSEGSGILLPTGLQPQVTGRWELGRCASLASSH